MPTRLEGSNPFFRTKGMKKHISYYTNSKHELFRKFVVKKKTTPTTTWWRWSHVGHIWIWCSLPDNDIKQIKKKEAKKILFIDML